MLPRVKPLIRLSISYRDRCIAWRYCGVRRLTMCLSWRFIMRLPMAGHLACWCRICIWLMRKCCWVPAASCRLWRFPTRLGGLLSGLFGNQPCWSNERCFGKRVSLAPQGFGMIARMHWMNQINCSGALQECPPNWVSPCVNWHDEPAPPGQHSARRLSNHTVALDRCGGHRGGHPSGKSSTSGSARDDGLLLQHRAFARTGG